MANHFSFLKFSSDLKTDFYGSIGLLLTVLTGVCIQVLSSILANCAIIFKSWLGGPTLPQPMRGNADGARKDTMNPKTARTTAQIMLPKFVKKLFS